jgi:pimeloyl-ACP methyl ester carboxylesterase
MWAVRDAAPSQGRFPVVVYAPGYSGSAWENADLCEYLASHGYLVIASPSMGARSRNMTSDLEGVEAQARDIAFLISYAYTLPNADLSRIAVAGFSWGGLSNLFAAARDPRITALVALDGSLRYWSGLISQAGYVRPQEMSIPLIYFAQGGLSLEDQARYLRHNDGPSVLNAWTHGDLTTVDMLGMTHAEYSSMFQRNEDIWWKLTHVYHLKNGNFGRADGATGYAWVARYTRQFLDAYLKKDTSAMAFLKRTPADNGVPRYVMNVNHRPAFGSPATLDTFRAEVVRSGFRRIAEAYDRLHGSSKEFLLSEDAVNEWAEELLDGGYSVEAVRLLTFGLGLYPESSVLYTTMGLAREISGDAEQALASYRCAVAKDPQNGDAAWKLSSLTQMRVQ